MPGKVRNRKVRGPFHFRAGNAPMPARVPLRGRVGEAGAGLCRTWRIAVAGGCFCAPGRFGLAPSCVRPRSFFLRRVRGVPCPARAGGGCRVPVADLLHACGCAGCSLPRVRFRRPGAMPGARPPCAGARRIGCRMHHPVMDRARASCLPSLPPGPVCRAPAPGPAGATRTRRCGCWCGACAARGVRAIRRPCRLGHAPCGKRAGEKKSR